MIHDYDYGNQQFFPIRSVLMESFLFSMVPVLTTLSFVCAPPHAGAFDCNTTLQLNSRSACRSICMLHIGPDPTRDPNPNPRPNSAPSFSPNPNPYRNTNSLGSSRLHYSS